MAGWANNRPRCPDLFPSCMSHGVQCSPYCEGELRKAHTAKHLTPRLCVLTAGAAAAAGWARPAAEKATSFVSLSRMLHSGLDGKAAYGRSRTGCCLLAQREHWAERPELGLLTPGLLPPRPSCPCLRNGELGVSWVGLGKITSLSSVERNDLRASGTGSCAGWTGLPAARTWCARAQPRVSTDLKHKVGEGAAVTQTSRSSEPQRSCGEGTGS